MLTNLEVTFSTYLKVNTNLLANLPVTTMNSAANADLFGPNNLFDPSIPLGKMDLSLNLRMTIITTMTSTMKRKR